METASYNDPMQINNPKVVIELDEDDAVLLLGHLAEMNNRVPSALRPRSPWTRIYEQLMRCRAGVDLWTTISRRF
jgi:hypothetical protein